MSQLARGAGIVLFGRLGGRTLQLATQMLLARWLGPAGFGLYGIGWTLAVLGGTLATLGFDRAVLRFVPGIEHRMPGAAGSIVRQATLWSAASAAAICTTALVTSDFLAVTVFGKPELSPVLKIMAAALVPMALLKTLAAVTRCSTDMRASVLSEDVGPPLLNLLGAAIAFGVGAGLLGAVVAMAVSFALSAVLAAAYAVRRFPSTLHPSPHGGVAVRTLLTFALPASAAGLFSMLAGRVDRLLVGSFLGAADVGAYHAASQVSVLFAVIVGATNAVFTPMIPKLHESGNTGELRELLIVSTKWALYLSMPFALLVFAMPGEVMGGLFGSEFADASYVLVILTGGMLCNVATGGVGFVLMMTGNHKRYSIIAMLSLVWSVCINVWAIPRYGLMGAALGSTSAVLLLGGASLLQVVYLLRLWPYDLRYWKGGVAATAVLLLLVAVRNVVDLPPLPMLAIGLVLGAGTFVAVLVLLGLDLEDRAALDHIGRRFSAALARPT